MIPARAWRRAALGLLLAVSGAAAQAGALRYCDRHAEPTAQQKDVLLRFAAAVKTELDAEGAPLALIARSGLDLGRFGLRYSHAGLSLRRNPEAPWAVRQLYFACDENRPRLFDQGMAGFVMGVDDANQGYVSLVFLPAEAEARVEALALDDRAALALLGADYSANAYPFSTRFQNCNQWLAELLAGAWGAGAEGGARAAAQAWLRRNGYEPTVIDPGALHLMALTPFLPWIHNADHPTAEIERRVYSVSMPASIEAFVHARLPAARRVELCHDTRRIVVHRGWDDLAPGCVPGRGDEVIALD